ncbi:exonuclease 1 isoform X2 [Centruroides vittatus]|uniref:exonuclease 1 isoform X2 n=1 Tax=Centruroides vittatus TaxID=120091 RepID=UPI0035102B7E
MGIQGLLPFLKKAKKEVNIKNFSGCTVAVDTYCWLHKGAFSCAEKLAKGEKTDGYVHYCMKMVNMLLAAGTKPIMVFDGRNLPFKSITEEKRREKRNKNKIQGKEFLCEGKLKEARECFQRCVDITPEMAHDVILACRQKGIDCIVAPYEADAQLAYLNKCGIAQIIITEDSDLILFGCEKVIFKMDSGGSGILIEATSLYKCMGLHSENFTFDKFRYMCILSGCDYLPSLPGIGLAKSCKFFSKTTNPNLHMVLSKLPTYLKMPNLTVTSEYKELFIKANNTFLYQLIFCPLERKLKPLNPYPSDINFKDLHYAGEYFPDNLAYQLALGNINVNTMKVIDDFDPLKQSKVNKNVTWDNRIDKVKSIWSPSYQIPKISNQEGIVCSAVSTKGKQVTIDVKRILKPVTANVQKKKSPSDKELFDMYGELEDSFVNPSTNKRLKTDNVCEKTENITDKTSLKDKPINIFKINAPALPKVVKSRFFFSSNKNDSPKIKSVEWLDEIQKEYNQTTSTPKAKTKIDKTDLHNESIIENINSFKDNIDEELKMNNFKFKWNKCKNVNDDNNINEIIPCSSCLQVPFKTVKILKDTDIASKEDEKAVNSSKSDISSSPSVSSQTFSNCSIDTFSFTQDSDICESPLSQTVNNSQNSLQSSPENRNFQDETVSPKTDTVEIRPSPLKSINSKNDLNC